METAIPITGYADYLVTDEGNVYSMKYGRKKRLKLYRTDKGYLEVTLYSQSTPKNFQVHRLVLSMFVGPCPEGMETCHNDGNPMNNSLSNLRWDTPKSNTADQIKHGTAHHVMTDKCNQAAADVHRGKRLTDEHKKAVSESLLGMKRSDQAKENYRNSFTQERKQKCSERMKRIWAQRRENNGS